MGIAGSLRLPRDDPVARYAFEHVLKNRVRTEGTENTEKKMAKGGDRGVVKTTYPAITPLGHRGVSASSFREGAIRF